MTSRLNSLLLALLFFAGCHAKKAPSAESRADKKSLKSLAAFYENLHDARVRLELQTGLYEPEPPSDAWSSVKTTRDALPLLQWETSRLRRAADRLHQPGYRPPTTTRSVEVTGPTTKATLDLAGPPANQTFTITNNGTAPIVNPRLQLNGQADWHDIQSLLDLAIKPGQSDREKALALWQFLIDSRQHDYPANGGPDLHDPVRLLNVYGYGYCDDAATSLMVLARAAGLQARVWKLGGHVVPEIFFDGRWHMLDPDGEIYYLEDDDITIADVATLQRRPDLIRRKISPIYRDPEKLVKIYAPDENEIGDYFDKTSSSAQRMDFTLRPGESILRSRTGWGTYFAASNYQPPITYGNGRLTYRPVLSTALFASGAEQATGFTPTEKDGRWSLESASSATVTYRFALPYAFLDAKVSGAVELSPHGTLEIAASADGHQWQPVFTTRQSAPFTAAFPSFFPNGFGEPLYRYLLRFTVSGGPARLSGLTMETTFQCAPKSLPELRTGPNTIQYQSATPGPATLTFGYDVTPPAK